MRFGRDSFSLGHPVRPHTIRSYLPSAAGILIAALSPAVAEAQLIRSSLDTLSSIPLVTGTTTNTTTTSTGILGTGATLGSSSPGSGVLGTGVVVGTSNTSTGILGTGVTVGTTDPGSGVLGTGATIGTGTTSGGVLGTGVVVGTTGPGDGILGTGVTLGTSPTGTPGTPTNPGTPPGPGTPTSGNPVPTGGPGPGGLPVTTGSPGPVTTTDTSGLPLSLRLTQLEQQINRMHNDFPLRGNDMVGRGAPVAAGSDSVAAGYGASAGGDNAAAYGSGANASAANSVAIGNSATAAHANSVALGTNARTTRANQVAVGSANSTYTMAGVASSASRAAQSGATQFVTTDASGNLATSGFGPSHIAALDSRVGTLETSVSRLQQDMRGAYQGTAIALALTGAVLPEGKNFAVSTNFGTYRGETGFGASGIARVSDNVFVSGGIGLGTSGQTNLAGRGGVTLAW